jgi:hypothetical protein
MFLRLILVFFTLLCRQFLYAQDTTQPWFSGGDPGFYRYLEDRFQSLGIQKPNIEKTGESVVFEFVVTDSGYVDSIKIQQCFNFQLCYQLRQILMSLPRGNASVIAGKTVEERRVYVLDIKRYRDGYQIEPSFFVPYQGTVSYKLKWAIVLVAVIAMLIVVVK